MAWERAHLQAKRVRSINHRLELVGRACGGSFRQIEVK
jgi:hypothetical protein